MVLGGAGLRWQTVIHRQRWALTLNADGTTTATSPNGQRTWHSHSPPTPATAL